MELSKLVEEILKITNESPYGWLDMDSVEAGEIQKLLNKSIHNVSGTLPFPVAILDGLKLDVAFKSGGIIIKKK